MAAPESRLWGKPGEARITTAWLLNESGTARWPADLSRHLEALMTQHGCWTFRKGDVGQATSPSSRILADFLVLCPPEVQASDAGGALQDALIKRLQSKISHTKDKLVEQGKIRPTAKGVYELCAPAPDAGGPAGAPFDEEEAAVMAWLGRCSLGAMVRVVGVMMQRVGYAPFLGVLSEVWAPLTARRPEEMTKHVETRG